jgi:hypothetical protein
MSIGFSLLGELQDPVVRPARFFDQAENWIMKACNELEPICRRDLTERKSSLLCTFHPAAEEVEISLIGSHQLTVSANTSTVGPGYHIYLCQLLHKWTNAFGIQWRKNTCEDDSEFFDEAEYFFTGKEENVYKHMATWIRSLTGLFFDGNLDPNHNGTPLCMPMNVSFRSEALAITPLGPRDRDWLHGVSVGSIEAMEFFPWFDAEPNAKYFLNRALVQMWSSVRWRKPINEKETALLQSVANSLARAYALDTTLTFPWNEWNEILTFLEKEQPDFIKAKMSGQGRIGYRRRPVRTQLPGDWSIETDGSFSEFQCDEDGDLCAFDPPREIWFTAYSITADDPSRKFDEMRHDLKETNPELINERENYVAAANFSMKEKDGEKYYLLKSSNITLLNRSVCTIVFINPEERDWAIGVWKSLQHPSAKEKE